MSTSEVPVGTSEVPGTSEVHDGSSTAILEVRPCCCHRFTDLKGSEV